MSYSYILHTGGSKLIYRHPISFKMKLLKGNERKCTLKLNRSQQYLRNILYMRIDIGMEIAVDVPNTHVRKANIFQQVGNLFSHRKCFLDLNKSSPQ